jgi:DNA invertase Pin-like site-specific DNA recombinase
VGFQSLGVSIDTTTSGGRLVFNIFGALAEFERKLIQERTRAGLAAARARGRSIAHGSSYVGNIKSRRYSSKMNAATRNTNQQLNPNLTLSQVPHALANRP